MIGRIIALLILIVILVVTFSWLAGGGWERIKAVVPRYSNPLGDFWETQKGKPVDYSIQAMAPAVPQFDGESISSGSEIVAKAEATKQFGDPSPLRGQITIEPSYSYYTGTKDVSDEYIVIRASSANTAPINITGWSLASAVSGTRVFIPSGTILYRLGSISSLGGIHLAAGDGAVINSGPSPVGVSFRTNICTGYLAQFQSFSPNLSNTCPSPRSELPNTLDNLQTYGAECIDFVASLPSCTYYLGTFPNNTSPSCRSFVANALSYNSCIDRHQWGANFAGRTWRVYIGNQRTLWHPLHDVVRLLDASGRTVDVWSY